MNKSEIAPHVWQIDSGIPGPTVLVLGGVHGSEKPGVEIVQRLLGSDLSRIVERGKLILGIGNPLAVEQNRRFLEGDRDLNRCFALLTEAQRQTVAGKRAEVLKLIIARADVLLDLHATIKPSDPMVLSPNDPTQEPLKSIIPVLGIEKIITGSGLYKENGDGVTTQCYAHAQGKTGITVEAGWQEDMTLVARVHKAVLRALAVIGVSKPSDEVVEPVQHEYFESYWSVAATDDFQFVGEWGNFEELPSGTHFATRDGKKLVTPWDSLMVFQKKPENIVPGDEACQLLRRQ